MKSTLCCAWTSYSAAVPNQWLENTGTTVEQAASAHTGARRTHMVSIGFELSEVSSCCQVTAPANPYFATIATPLFSPLLAAHPSTCRTFCGDPHTVSHASSRPRAMTAGSFLMRATSVLCTNPTPQAFSGCVVSVQLLLAVNVAVWPDKGAWPSPDLMLRNAILKVP